MQITEITAKQFMKKLKDPVRAKHLEQIAKIRTALREGGYKMDRVVLAKKQQGFATKLRFEVPIEATGAFSHNAELNAKHIVENNIPQDAMVDDCITLWDNNGNKFLSFIVYLDISDSYSE